MKTFMIVLMGGVLLASVIGCETTKGAGKDIENTGENIQDAVK